MVASYYIWQYIELGGKIRQLWPKKYFSSQQMATLDPQKKLCSNNV